MVRKLAASAMGHGQREEEVERSPGRMGEAIGAGIAARKGDGPRVRDAATHVDSGREVVDRRDPHRGVEPRCLAEAGGR